jgi:glucose/arabinose dehydrogenase
VINLAALALFVFAATLVTIGLADYMRSRAPRALIPTGIGVFLLLLLFFFIGGFAAPLVGDLALPGLLLFFTAGILPLGVSLAAAAAAVGLVWLARRRFILAFGVVVAGALVVLGALYAYLQVNAPPAQANASASIHPGLADITVPEGFRVETFADNLSDPSALALDDAGNLYYSQLVDGNIVRLRDTNGDNVADETKVFASGFKNPRGLAWRDGTLYVSSRGQINTLRDTNGDGAADENKVIRDGLFSLDIQHSNNGLAFGPDGKLYLSIGGPRTQQLDLKGSTYYYEGQARDDWMFGGILVMDPDGKNVKLFARGLRNPYSLTFDARGTLYATDNGDDAAPFPDGNGDELNRIEAGADYGYPYFFGNPPPWSASRAPLFAFPPHTSPTGVAVYDATAFPESYRGDLFVGIYWHGLPGTNFREVVRLAETGKASARTWQTRSFVQGLDRPTALLVGKDGALYIADMRGGKADPEFPGVIYRVSYVGKK